MESDEVFCKAMVAFCRQHAKMQGDDESFWMDEARTWAERLKAKNAFWHQFAGKPELPAKYDGASTSDRQCRIIDEVQSQLKLTCRHRASAPVSYFPVGDGW
jgi:hypothetical protein